MSTISRKSALLATAGVSVAALSRMTPAAAQSVQPVRITPTLDGPNKVTGDIELSWPSGNRVDIRSQADKDGAIYLCRCGRSLNKPFCDGTHAKVGFRSREGDDTAHRE